MNQTTNDDKRALYFNMKHSQAVNQSESVSLFKRIKYAINPLPLNWRTTWERLTSENENLEYLVFIGIASILGQGAVMFKLWLLGDI